MTATRWTWAVIFLIYLCFFSWYTSFGGPLTEEEIEHYLSLFESREGDPAQRQLLRDFMESDTGDDFVMINIMEMYDTPLQIEGVEPGETTDEVFAELKNSGMVDLGAPSANSPSAGSSGEFELDADLERLRALHQRHGPL